MVIGLGGTIASDPEKSTILGPDEVFAKLGLIIPEDIAITYLDFMRVGSSHITPENQIRLALTIQKEYEKYHAFLILHGTDTMAWTASALAFMLRGLHKPIVLTGSMIPSTMEGSDARANVSDSIRFTHKAIESNISGVYIVFNHKVILGVRASKISSTDIDAFGSINYPYVGYARGDEVVINKVPRRILDNDKLKIDDKIEDRIMVLKAFPGMKEYLLDAVDILKLRGVVIEAFGLGGLPKNITEKLKSLAKDIPVLIITQPTYGGVDPLGYGSRSSFFKFGLIPACDMSKEAAVIKFMWILGKTNEIEEVRRLMMQNYEDEINPCLS
ncbi:MAG: asparaginase [Candidatus Bathyarchaeia archaeon]